MVNGETSTNLVSGFRKCGIYPLDRSQVISRIPQKKSPEEKPVEQTAQTVSDAVLDMLRELRPSTSNNPRKKRTKVCVEAGKSIQCEDLVNYQRTEEVDSEDDELLSTPDLHSDSEQSDFIEDESLQSDENVITNVSVNDYVVVKLPSSKDRYAVARVLEINGDAVSVKMFTKIHCKFVQSDRRITILPSQIVKALSPPAETRRGFTFNENELGCIVFEYTK